MKEAPIEGSFTLNSTGEQGITGGDDFLLKMSFPGQSLENLWNPCAGSEWEVLFLYFYTQVPPHCAVSQNSPDLIRSHTRGRMEVHGENRKQEDARDSLSFASFLVFFINAENLANTSFPAELDSGCWVPSLGYLEKFKAEVSQISNVWVGRIQSRRGRNAFLWADIKIKTAP